MKTLLLLLILSCFTSAERPDEYFDFGTVYRVEYIHERHAFFSKTYTIIFCDCCRLVARGVIPVHVGDDILTTRYTLAMGIGRLKTRNGVRFEAKVHRVKWPAKGIR